MCVASVFFCSSWDAKAVERQWRLGADLGFAGVSSTSGVVTGLGGGAHAAYGLTDSYDLLIEADHTSHPLGSNLPNARITSLGVGAAYSLDIVQWVPYFGLLLGGYRFDGGAMKQPIYDFGMQFALGFDYRFSPSWSTGLQVRYHTFSEEPFSAHYMTTMFRFEYLTGW